jgi:hypothetical protein
MGGSKPPSIDTNSTFLGHLLHVAMLLLLLQVPLYALNQNPSGTRHERQYFYLN